MFADRVGHLVTGGMLSWYEAKMFIEHASVISSDAIHVLVGVVIWLIIALLSRRSIESWLPWLGLFALILFNEMVDLCVEQWPDKAMQYGEGAKDLALTMFLPTALLVLSRMLPKLFAEPKLKRWRRGSDEGPRRP